MTKIHNDILEIFFWTYIEAGVPPQETPLLTGVYDRETIHEVITDFYKISPALAEDVISGARAEVIL